MKILVVEDDFVSRLLMQRVLSSRGEVHVAVDGQEAVMAYESAVAEGAPYQLICLDIMMPKMDGHEVLRRIRDSERARGIAAGLGARILMTTAVESGRTVLETFRDQCDGYLIKPIDRETPYRHLDEFGLKAA